MKKISIFFRVFALPAIVFISCKHDPIIPPTLPRTDIHLDSNVRVGPYLVDKDGNTLYYFSNDVNGLSSCTRGCLTAWPIFYAETVNTIFTGGLAATDFKTITTAAGAKQTAYKGRPLY